jgi:hypothetical protein
MNVQDGLSATRYEKCVASDYVARFENADMAYASVFVEASIGVKKTLDIGIGNGNGALTIKKTTSLVIWTTSVSEMS